MKTIALLLEFRPHTSQHNLNEHPNMNNLFKVVDTRVRIRGYPHAKYTCELLRTTPICARRRISNVEANTSTNDFSYERLCFFLCLRGPLSLVRSGRRGTRAWKWCWTAVPAEQPAELPLEQSAEQPAGQKQAEQRLQSAGKLYFKPEKQNIGVFIAFTLIHIFIFEIG